MLDVSDDILECDAALSFLNFRPILVIRGLILFLRLAIRGLRPSPVMNPEWTRLPRTFADFCRTVMYQVRERYSVQYLAERIDIASLLGLLHRSPPDEVDRYT